MSTESSDQHQWIGEMIASDREWWATHAGELDALPKWLALPENVERHRKLSFLAYEAVIDSHPCHALMGETIDWYSTELMETLREAYWPDTSHEEFVLRARRYIAVWGGVRVLKPLLGLRMDSETFSNVLLRAMGLSSFVGAGAVPGFQINTMISGQHSTKLSADGEMVVRAVFDTYDGTLGYPHDLEEVAVAAGIDFTDVNRIFGSMDDFIIAESLFEERALALVLGDIESDPVVVARRAGAFISMMFHNYNGLSKLRVAEQAAAMNPEHEFHRFYSARMMRQFKFLLGVCTDLAERRGERDRTAAELDALTIHAMWIGLSVQALYRPHSFDIGAELVGHVKSILLPQDRGFDVRLSSVG